LLPTFVIGLREGVEAALIVGIIAAFLVKEDRRDALRPMWAGVGIAVAICVAVGVALQVLDEQLPQREQEGLETIVGLLAVGMVTFMIVWMRRHARGLSGELRANASSALAQGSTIALVAMAFFAVLREGFETAVFLLAAFNASENAATAGLGAALGVVAAVIIGYGIYKGGVRINLTRFFRFTGLVLVLVAAGLVATALHTANEAGWITGAQAEAIDLSWLVVPGTWTASLLTGMLGLQPHPTVAEVTGWLVYAVPMVVFLLWPQRSRSRRTTMAATTIMAIGLVAVLAGCGSGSGRGDAEGGDTVALKITDAGCEPANLKLPAGPHTFEVTNDGASKATELEIVKGGKILGERENLTDGLSGSFSLDLPAGTYELYCPGADEARRPLVVTGSSTAQTDPRLGAAVRGYDRYVRAQVRGLAARARAFTAAVQSGDVAQAKRLFATTRAPYERIEPVAESFGALDPEIDARVNDVEPGTRWTGFHRIEKGLWDDGSTEGLAPVAEKLQTDVGRLRAKVATAEYQPAQIANGAVELLNEVSKSKITGEEDRYSHTDLSDFEANVDGAEEAFHLLRPVLADRDPELARTLAVRFAAVHRALDVHRRGAGFVAYDTVTERQRRTLSQAVDALAEPLSQVGGVVVKS
jgi:high-affinity iron transporter